VIGDGQTPVYPAYVKDVARAVTELVRREDARDKVLEIGGPQRLTMDDVIRTVQEVLGRRRPLLHHPPGLMKVLVRPMALLPTPMLSPGAVDFITQTVEIDPRPAVEYLGFALRPLRAGLDEYVA
jgi:uncharacterized protein YbjT (DUF2867 family)